MNFDKEKLGAGIFVDVVAHFSSIPFSCSLLFFDLLRVYSQWRIQKILVGGDLKPKPQKFGCLHQN